MLVTVYLVYASYSVVTKIFITFESKDLLRRARKMLCVFYSVRFKVLTLMFCCRHINLTIHCASLYISQTNYFII